MHYLDIHQSGFIPDMIMIAIIYLSYRFLVKK